MLASAFPSLADCTPRTGVLSSGRWPPTVRVREARSRTSAPVRKSRTGARICCATRVSWLPIFTFQRLHVTPWPACASRGQMEGSKHEDERVTHTASHTGAGQWPFRCVRPFPVAAADTSPGASGGLLCPQCRHWRSGATSPAGACRQRTAGPVPLAPSSRGMPCSSAI
jgi:hypothetical protein